MESGSSITLIFYRIGQQWWKEPTLNIVAAMCQMSPFTHVEIAIGETAGSNGMMTNVARIFNDNVGVEIVERTGRNPQYVYLQIGCSVRATEKMLRFAKCQLAKPFSNYGMARSLLWPRRTDNTCFFCAELVAAILREGGLMAPESNPGSATPEQLHHLYSKKSAATANPYLLRETRCQQSLTFANTISERRQLVERKHFKIVNSGNTGTSQRHNNHALQMANAHRALASSSGVQLSFSSLNFNKK